MLERVCDLQYTNLFILRDSFITELWKILLRYNLVNISKYVHQTLILSCLRDFVSCCKKFLYLDWGSISQLWNTVGR